MMGQITKRSPHVALAATLAVLTTSLMAGSAMAAVPGTVHIDGYLHSSGGGAVSDGNYAVTFALYEKKTDATPLWSEGPVTLAVKAGQWSHGLGTLKPLSVAKIAATGQLWLGLKVAGDPELPRMRIQSTFYALAAATAAGISCTGCVSAAAIKADAALNLSGQTVTAKSFVGDGSKLTGITIPSGVCGTGLLMKGIAKDGKPICAKASPLPDDGVAQVSQGLVQVVGDLYNGVVPVNVPDNSPLGAIAKVSIGSVGSVNKITVSIDVTVNKGTSGIDKLKVCLIAPGGKNHSPSDKPFCGGTKRYLLHSLKGSGKKLTGTWPDPDKTISGDITEWYGKNPQGTWQLVVVDTDYNGNDPAIGTINKFTISARTTGNKKINITSKTIFDGGVKIGGDKTTCNAAAEGTFRWNKSSKQAEVCNGTAWGLLAPKANGAIYRWVVWDSYAAYGTGWHGGNNATLFGGVNPSNWGNGNYTAAHMSSDSRILRSFFYRKGPALGSGVINSLVIASSRSVWGSSNMSRHAAALFRIRNKTGGTITWKTWFYSTAFASWNNYTSVAINGSSIWSPGGNYYAWSGHSLNISIPAKRTSTVIFVASDTGDYGSTRDLHLSFYNNCLSLPSGLEYVDDLDTKPNGWNH